MVDLHCHILPGLDDGAHDLPDSLALGRQAEVDGIDRVCATPHIRHDHDVRVEQLPGRVEALNVRLREAGIGVRVLVGGEVAETAVEALGEEELRLLALGDGDWILLEPAPGPLGESLLRSVEWLAARGHRALIAHPERHLSADMLERMAALVGAGALIQATADFFLCEETAAGMLAMAEAGLVHVLGSDAHSAAVGRPLALAAAFERLGASTVVAPYLDWIAGEAPAAIVAGEPLRAPFTPRL